MEIRVARYPNDVLGLLAVRRSFGLTASEVEKKRETYLEDLCDEERRVCLIATDAHGRAIGFVQLVWQLDGHYEGEACLHDLRVKVNHQSRGVGRSLVLQIETLAVERGFQSLRLWVEKSNTRAIKFYEMMGYERFDARKTPAEFTDCFLMCKRLEVLSGRFQ